MKGVKKCLPKNLSLNGLNFYFTISLTLTIIRNNLFSSELGLHRGADHRQMRHTRVGWLPGHRRLPHDPALPLTNLPRPSPQATPCWKLEEPQTG
jgi:hypothetical protein